jgi:hypothetical protein
MPLRVSPSWTMEQAPVRFWRDRFLCRKRAFRFDTSSNLAHAIEVDEHSDECGIRSWTILENSKQIRFERYLGNMSGMEGECSGS